MANPLNLVRALRAWLTIVRDPNQLGEVFALADNIASPEVLGQMAEYFARDPVGRRALVERPRIGRIDMAAMRALPEGTLGWAFARHLDENGLDPSALPSRPAHDPHSFIQAHLYETHDVWHAVTGFGADVAGELGLQAFYLAQFPARLGGAILAAGLLNTTLFAFDDRDARMDEIARGWLMGRAARPFFGVDWSRRWGDRLEDIQRDLGVDLGSSDQRRKPPTPTPKPTPTPTPTRGLRAYSRRVTS